MNFSRRAIIRWTPSNKPSAMLSAHTRVRHFEHCGESLFDLSARQHSETRFETYFGYITLLYLYEVTSRFPSALAFQLHQPAVQRSVVLFVHVQKFDAHSDAWLYDAHHRQRLYHLIF